MQVLGSDILAQIEGLISQIDCPTVKQKQAHKMVQKYLHPSSTIKQKKNNYFQKLYGESINRNLKDLQKQKRFLGLKEKYYDNFRVRNKRSFEILAKANLEPLQKRTNKIIQEKQFNLKRIRQEQNQRLIGSKSYDEICKKSYSKKKHSPDDIKKINLQLKDEIFQRNHKINNLQLKVLQNKNRQKNEGVPKINKSSVNLSQILCKKNDYNENVFKRLYDYRIYHQNKKQANFIKCQQNEGNFKPHINSYSNYLVQKSRSRTKSFKKQQKNSHQMNYNNSFTHIISNHENHNTPLFNVESPERIEQRIETIKDKKYSVSRTPPRNIRDKSFSKLKTATSRLKQNPKKIFK